MKNKLTDLNNYLFEQLERLNDDELTGEELEIQLKKTKAVTEVSQNIINNAKQVLDSCKFMENAGYGWVGNKDSITLLVGGGNNEQASEPNNEDKKRMALNYFKEI